MINIVLCQDSWEPICFKLGMNDLDVHSSLQGHKKADACAVILLNKLHEATQMFIVIDYVREMTVKKSFMVNMDRLSTSSSCADFHE